MPQYLTLPNGASFPILEGESPEQATLAAMDKYPEAFGFEQEKKQGPGGFGAAFKAGVQNIAGEAALTAGKAGIIRPETAEKFAKERRAAAEESFTPTQDSFAESPWQNTKELLGGSLPYAVAPLAAAGAAGLAGAPAAVGAGAAALLSGAQFTGTNLQRQMDTGKTLNEASGANAALTAIPQAALEALTFRMIPGIGRLFGAAGEKISTETARELAQQTAGKIAADYLAATGKAMTVGALTEATQQTLERAQAGLSVTDPEARAEVLQSLFGGALLSGVLAPAGRFVERGMAKRESRELQDQEQAAQLEQQRQQAEQEQKQRLLTEGDPSQMGPRFTPGDQTAIEGMDGARPDPAAAVPADQGDPLARAAELRTQLRGIDDMIDQIRSANLQGATTAQRMQRRQQIEQLEAAQKQAAAELATLPVQVPPETTQAKIAKLEKQLRTADERGDDAKALQISQQLDALREQGETDVIPQDLFTRMGGKSESEAEYTQRVRTPYAQRGTAAGQARIADVEAEEAATLEEQRRMRAEEEARVDEENARLLATMREQAAGTAQAVEQPRLFPEVEQGQQRAARGTGGTARSEAQIQTDIQIARASRDREALENAVQELRALRDATRTRDRELKAGQTDASELRNKELEQAAGMRLPPEAAKRQALTDARYRAFGQMVSILDNVNRGRARMEELVRAQRQVEDSLVKEIEALQGSPLTVQQRQSVQAEAQALLDDLRSRFGDTRSVVNTGTRKDPQMEGVQRGDGSFRQDLPAAGAGPTGFGLENQESRPQGDRTFANRYAASQSILEGLDDIRNRRAGAADARPGVDRNDSNATPEERLQRALSAAQGTPAAQLLLQQVADSPVKTPELLESAVQAGLRAQRGQDITEQQRAITDELQRLEGGKRSESEGAARAVQTELFDSPERGKIFDTFEAFEQYLAGDALAALKLSMGQTRETVARVDKLTAPLVKKAAELEKRVMELVRKKNELVELNALERNVAASQVADGEAAVSQLQGELDDALAEYRDAFVEAQGKLDAALKQSADIAGQIQANGAELEARIKQDETFRALRNRTAERMRAALENMKQFAAGLARAKEKMAREFGSLIGDDWDAGVDMKKFLAAKDEAGELQRKAIAAQNEMTSLQRAMGDPVPDIPSDVFLNFLQQDGQLQEQQRNLAARMGGLTAARNRAQRALDAASASLASQPEVQARLRNAQDIRAVAKSLQRDAEANAARRTATEIAPLEREISMLDTQARGLRETASRRQEQPVAAKAREEAENRPVQTDAAGQRRAAEQRRLEARQEGPGTARERISFEKRREQQAGLEEAPRRIAALEEILAGPQATPEQREEAAKALVEINERAAKVDAKIAGQMQRLEGGMKAQRELLERIASTRAEIDATEAGTPRGDKARERYIKQMNELQKRAAYISKVQGITRERIAPKAEREAQAAAAQRATQGKPVTPEFEALTEGQTRRRTSSPATRTTTPGSGFRTGTPETADQRRLSTSSRIVESQKPIERDTPLSKREMRSANKAAAALDHEAAAQIDQRIREETAAANKAAEAERRKSPEQRLRETEAARRAALALQDEPEAGRGPRSRVQDLFENDLDLDEDAALREGRKYNERVTTQISEEAAEALFDGRLLDAVDELAKTGSTPAVRELAATLRPLLLRTKVRVQADLRHNGQKAEGKYTPFTNTVDLDSMSMTEETILHELVHAATMPALLGRRDLNAAQTRAVADLRAVYDQIKNDPRFKGDYATVNLAEFVSELMVDPQLRDKLDVPAEGGSFLRRIYDGLLRLLGLKPITSEKAMQDAYKLFAPSRSFSFDGSVPSITRGVFPDRVPQAMSGVPQSVVGIVGDTVGRTATLGDKVSGWNLGLRWRTSMADRWAPVEALLKRGVAKGQLSDMQALQTRYHMRMHEDSNRFTGTSVADGVVQLKKQDDGVYTVEGKPGPNLLNIAKTLSKASVGNEQFTEQLFTSWLAVQRAERPGVGYEALNFGTDAAGKPLMNAAKAREIKDFVASRPEVKEAFEAARAEYAKYNEGLMKFLADAGAIDRALAKELAGGDYVPFYRERGGFVEMVVPGSKPFRIGNTVDQPYLKELVGGNDRILPFFAGALQNTGMVMRMGLRNLQAKDVSNVLQTMGLAKIMRGDGPGNNDVVRFKRDGESYWAQFDPEAFPDDIPPELVVQGMQGIKTAVPALVRAMGVPTNILRKAITRMPLYAMRQLVRDPLHAWLTTGGNFTPVVSSIKELAKATRGKSETELTLQRAGAISSNIQTGDTQDVERMLRDISAGKPGWNKAMAKLDAFALQGDAATRGVLYESFRKQGMTHTQALLGAAESMNFSRRGTSSSLHWLSTLVPFFNAQIQGIDAVYRAAKGDTIFEKQLDIQRQLLKRGAIMMAATLAYAAAMQDDETYKNATPEERAMSWFVSIPGTDDKLRVPIPFELGLIFKSLPEALFNTMFGDSTLGETAKALGKQVWMSTPLSLPTAINPLVETAVNYSFFTDQPIESQREQGVVSAERYRQGTTELAKLLGKTGVASPVQVEHLVRGYLGSAGILLMAMANPVLRPFTSPDGVEKPASTLGEMAVFGAAFQPTTGRGAVNAAFDDVQRFQQAHQTYKQLLERGERAKAAEFATTFARDIAMASSGGAFRQQMGELAKVRRNIAASDMPPEQKRERIQQIKQMEIQLARRLREVGGRAS